MVVSNWVNSIDTSIKNIMVSKSSIKALIMVGMMIYDGLYMTEIN